MCGVLCLSRLTFFKDFLLTVLRKDCKVISKILSCMICSQTILQSFWCPENTHHHAEVSP